MITPGPSAIDPGANPGGLVAHAYRVPDAALVRVMRLHPATDVDDLRRQAEHNADEVLLDVDPDAGVYLVFYDGDTGERVSIAGLFAR